MSVGNEKAWVTAGRCRLTVGLLVVAMALLVTMFTDTAGRGYADPGPCPVLSPTFQRVPCVIPNTTPPQDSTSESTVDPTAESSSGSTVEPSVEDPSETVENPSEESSTAPSTPTTAPSTGRTPWTYTGTTEVPTPSAGSESPSNSQMAPPTTTSVTSRPDDDGRADGGPPVGLWIALLVLCAAVVAVVLAVWASRHRGLAWVKAHVTVSARPGPTPDSDQPPDESNRDQVLCVVPVAVGRSTTIEDEGERR